MLIAVRHARTAFNEDGKEKLRGWLPIPLSDEGIRESIETAKKLKNLKIPVDKFYSSPLKRAIQTANEIKDELDLDYTKTDSLKDWNTGVFTGKPVRETLSKIHDYMDSQDNLIPQGESFSSFYDRAYPFLKKLIESDDRNMIVTHNRVMTLLKALSVNDGSHPSKRILKNKGPVEPAGVIMIDPDWNLEIIHNPESVREVSHV